MFSIMVAIRRKPGMTHREYLTYIEQVHGELARAKPMAVRRYIQNHVFDGAFGAPDDATHLTSLPRDSVTELQFDDLASMDASFADEYTTTVILPDGKNFSDLPATISCLTEAEGDVNHPNSEGSVKVLFFLKALDGIDRGAFANCWEAAHQRGVKEASSIRYAVRNTVLPGPPVADDEGDSAFGGGEAISYDGVQSLWLDPDNSYEDMRRYEAAFIDGPDAWLDRSRSFWLFAHEVTIFDMTR